MEKQVPAMEIVDEVLRIKQVLQKGEDESQSVLVDSLRRLQFVDISCDVLKATMIGKPVCVLRKHGKTQQIRLLAGALIVYWKKMADVWYDAQLAEGATHEKIIKELFSNQKKETSNKPLIQKLQGDATQDEKKEAKYDTEFLHKSKTSLIENKHRTIQGDTKFSPNEKDSQESAKKSLTHKKPLVKRKAPDLIGSQRVPNKALIQKKTSVQEDARKAQIEIGSQQNPNKPLIQEDERLDAARKRLWENYQQVENAKRQKRIQVVAPRNLPKENKHCAIQEYKRKIPNKIMSQRKSNMGFTHKKALIREGSRKAPNAIKSQEALNKALIQRKPLIQEDSREAPNEIKSQEVPNKALIQRKPLIQEGSIKAPNEIGSQQQPNRALIQKKPLVHEDELTCIDHAKRLEATRKRLRENYQRSENAKRKRRIQVVDLRNLPKEVLDQTKPYMKK